MERIRLDIIPKGLMPVCHASQYDAGRVIRLDLMDGLQGYSLTNEEIELNVRKPDGHIVTASVDVVAGNTYVDIVTTEQMCAVEGENICELKISKDDAEIYSLNFKMMVEKSVTEGGDPSESFIYNLRTQIAEGVAEEVATQYDSANVIFDNAPTSGHGTPYTVTSEGIKTAIDNAFDYDNTASGSLVHITDGADNIPMKSLTVSADLESAVNGFNVVRCGKNLVPFSNYVSSTASAMNISVISNGGIHISGQPNVSYAILTSNFNWYIPSGTAITLSITETLSHRLYIQLTYSDNTIDNLIIEAGALSATTTLTKSVSKIRLDLAGLNTSTTYDETYFLMLEIGNQATNYSVCTSNIYSIVLPSSMTHFEVDIASGEGTNLSDNSPFTITPVIVPTLSGINNIYNDCGNTAIEYYTNKATDILDFINSEIDKKNGDNIPIDENSQDSIKDYVDDEISSTKDYVDDGLSVKADSTDLPFVKYEEIDVTFDASGEGTLFNSVKFVVALKDIPSDQLYVGYVSYIAGSTIKVKALSRTAIAFSSQNNVSSTRKVGVYYLDNIATQ